MSQGALHPELETLKKKIDALTLEKDFPEFQNCVPSKEEFIRFKDTLYSWAETVDGIWTGEYGNFPKVPPTIRDIKKFCTQALEIYDHLSPDSPLVEDNVLILLADSYAKDFFLDTETPKDLDIKSNLLFDGNSQLQCRSEDAAKLRAQLIRNNYFDSIEAATKPLTLNELINVTQKLGEISGAKKPEALEKIREAILGVAKQFPDKQKGGKS